MKDDALDSLVTRLYRAAMSIKDAGWQELLKNAACSLSAARPDTLVAAVALTDTVLVLAEHARQLDEVVTDSLRLSLRCAMPGPALASSLLRSPQGGDAR